MWTSGCLGKLGIILLPFVIAFWLISRLRRGECGGSATDATNGGSTTDATNEDDLQAGRNETLDRLKMENTILWQGPTLALAAEAFLLTIALGKDSTSFARILSSFLAAVTAGAAYYLVDRKGIQVRELKGPHERDEPRGPKASDIWKIALGVFVLADAAVIWIIFCGDPEGWLRAR